MGIGITETEQKIIIDILNNYKKEYCFYFYGSRVKGTFEKTSDLDILIKGKKEMPLFILEEIKEKFDASKLPYIVNFSDYYSIDKNFYNRIENDLFPYDWKEYKLEDICIKITDGSHYSPKPQLEGFPMLSVKDMGEYDFCYTNCKYISIEDYKKMQQNDCVPQKGDILVAKDGSYLKQIFICKETKDEAILSSIAIFRPNTEIVLPRFLSYLLKSPNVYNYIKLNCVSGSALPRIVLKDFKKIELTIPALETQQKIAKVLGVIDDKIELNNKINENLEQQAQAIFKSWFVDFEPFGGTVPDDWEIKTLDELCNITAGGDKPKIVSKIKTSDCCIPIYSNGIDNDGLYGYTDRAKIFNESVTISARGTIGFTCLRLTPYVPIVRLISLEPKNINISAKYLYHAIKKMNIVGFGTTQQQITVPYCKLQTIILPQQEYMKIFANITNVFYSQISRNKCENEKLTQLRDTLLPKLMSGEIDVENVEI